MLTERLRNLICQNQVIEVKDTLTDASQYEALSKKAMQKVEAIKESLGLK